MTAPMPWLRLYNETAADPKLRLIAKKAGVTVNCVSGIWLAMLCHASGATPRGTIAGWDDELVASMQDLPVEQVAAVRTAMIGRLIDEGGALLAWDRRNPRGDSTGAERKRKQRARDAGGGHDDGDDGDDPSLSVTHASRDGHVTDRDITVTSQPCPRARKSESKRENISVSPGGDTERERSSVAEHQAPQPELIIDEILPPEGQAGPLDPKAELWRVWLPWLAERAQKPEAKLRPLLGKWESEHGAGAVLAVMHAAGRDPPGEPISWITKALSARRNDHDRYQTAAPSQRQSRPDNGWAILSAHLAGRAMASDFEGGPQSPDAFDLGR